MSLATRIESLVIRVAQEFNDVRAKAGNLANLTTTDKSSLVAAINELKAAVVSSAVIDDAQVATTSTYSSNKIVTLLDALKTEILGGADAAYDTLVEIQQLLQNGTSWSGCLARRRQQPRALRCCAVADRRRTTPGAQQHRCGRGQ
jgi:capsid protein